MRQISTATPTYRTGQAAGRLGVSDDTVRLWVERGRLLSRTGPEGRRLVDGADLAGFAAELHRGVMVCRVATGSRVGHLVHVELVVPHAHSHMTCDVVHDLGPDPGVVASATVTAINVALEILS